MTMWRALVQALASPLSGFLGDSFNRVYIVCAGTVLWGAMTAAIGASHTLPEATAWAAINGAGLALVLPCCQSLVADYFRPEARGSGFACLFTASAIGSMAGGFFATAVSGLHPLGLEGWRFAFYAVALTSAAAATAILALGTDPAPRMPAAASGKGMWAQTAAWAQEVGRSLWEVVRIRTFLVIVLQGIVGGIPWQAMGFITMYLQLLGFSDWLAGLLTALFWGGTIAGNLLGGIVGDLLVRRLPNAGRPLACQLSVASGIPLTLLLLRGLPQADGSASAVDRFAASYAALLFVMGMLVSWPQTNNSAMFAEVVPEALRSRVYAFDRCFEGAVAAFSGPLVGIVAARFGYVDDWEAGGARDPAHYMRNARALGNGLLVSLIAPWALELLAYGLLYGCLPRDKAAAAELELRRAPDSQQRLYGGSEDSDGAERTASGVDGSACTANGHLHANGTANGTAYGNEPAPDQGFAAAGSNLGGAVTKRGPSADLARSRPVP
ncbi:hypothetical protein WJX81_004002 [Elliptochloris bilobata]|uniref:Major facilitator superfamily (MFS) profile domain-containing protein n=1 Tax=Elliptochloris bilobata TaxID=381761 RepID=A0AAW1QY19_9CHLO